MNEKIYKFRSRNTDYNLRPWDYRTYASDYMVIFFPLVLFMVVFFNFVSIKLSGLSLIDIYHQFSGGDLDAKQKLIEVALSSCLVGGYTAIRVVKPIQLTKVSDVSENFYYSDSVLATHEFHKVQEEKFPIDLVNQPKNSLYLVRPEDCQGKPKFYRPVQMNHNASMLSMIVIGIAGAGKSAFLNRVYQEVLNNGHKMIVHAPDSKARDMLVASGYSCYVSAPWTTSSIYIDLAKTLDVSDMNFKNSLIDLVITSFFGYVDKNSSDSFFQQGAVYVLTASLKKLCSEKPGEWTLEDWRDYLVSLQETWQFKELIDTYYPEAGNIISESAEKMTASIIASITGTLADIGNLAMYYKQCRKPVDIRSWCLDEDKHQAIILCSDTQYEEISRISIALFVNLTIPFMLSSDREKAFNKSGKRVYQALDEFPNFARNIDTNKWIRIVNEGRKFGNSASIICQNTLQLVSCFKGASAQAEAKKFIGSFHTQVISQPSNEDETYLQSIVGEITWDDTEAQQTKDQSTGKISVSYQHKTRKENISFKKLQRELGFVVDENKKPLGLNVAIRLFESQLTAKVFMPFVNEFAKSNRDKFRDKIIVKDGLEYMKKKNGLSPLFYKEEKIMLGKDAEREMYIIREIKAKTKSVEKLIGDGKTMEAQKVNEDIINLKLELGFEFEEVEESPIGDASLKSGLHAVDHTGLASVMVEGAEVLDAMTKPVSGKGEVMINVASNEVSQKKKVLKKKKQNEIGD